MIGAEGGRNGRLKKQKSKEYCQNVVHAKSRRTKHIVYQNWCKSFSAVWLRFKAKNTGAADVNWSLSINNTSFSNPPKALAAGTESNLLSSSLGASGDVLVFLNPSPLPITVEVTVEDL